MSEFTATEFNWALKQAPPIDVIAALSVKIPSLAEHRRYPIDRCWIHVGQLPRMTTAPTFRTFCRACRSYKQNWFARGGDEVQPSTLPHNLHMVECDIYSIIYENGEIRRIYVGCCGGCDRVYWLDVEP